MTTEKKKSSKWFILGLGIFLLVGGYFSFQYMQQQRMQKANPISNEEIDVAYYHTPATLPKEPGELKKHSAIWNTLEKQEQEWNQYTTMTHLTHQRSASTRMLTTKKYSPCFHVENAGDVDVKITIYKNNKVLADTVVKAGSPTKVSITNIVHAHTLMSMNPQQGAGTYLLKLEPIGKGRCDAKGAITTGQIHW